MIILAIGLGVSIITCIVGIVIIVKNSEVKHPGRKKLGRAVNRYFDTKKE